MNAGQGDISATGVTHTIHDVATRLGHLRWLELQLFTVLGGAVTTTSDPTVKLAASEESRRAGGRAEDLAAVIPFIEGLTADDRTHCVDPDTADAVSAVAAAPPGRRAARAREALPPLIRAAYEEILAGTGPVADAPVRRVLTAGLAGLEAGRNPR